jgi:ADP-ribose pyrophosphatase YjhB (NUDIX family)/endonuclease/exonuclease/phosphatase family metal-dependent hydrolase
MSRRPGAYGLVRRDDAVLLVWDQADEQWYFPGGGIEAGESPEEALAREVTEETGYRLVSAAPLAIVDQPTVKGVTKECHFFLAEVDDTEPAPAEHESEWVPLTEAAGRVENASQVALALATPSLVTTVVDDLNHPVLPPPGTDHRQAAADAGCFHLVEVGPPPSGVGWSRPGGPPDAGSEPELRVVAANLERGRRLDDWVTLLTAVEPDVILISEADGGMARSGNRYVARELADRLGMAFVFAVEFVELSLGGDDERDELPADAANEFGVHGGAILSRFPLQRPAAVRFEFDGQWYGDDSPEPRVGGRCALVATVDDVVVVAPHLESHGGPTGRSRQVTDLLDLIEPYADGRPVIVGGDLNTHTVDLSGREEVGGELTPERFRDPIDQEPLFTEAAERGYEWSTANTDEPTHRTSRGRGDLNLDWFLTRGLRATGPEVIAALAPDDTPLSDHDLIAVIVRPERIRP